MKTESHLIDRVNKLPFRFILSWTTLVIHYLSVTNKFPVLQTSHAAMRNMMACTVTGQAAGVAAAVSLKTGALTGEVKIEAVQEELKRQGVRIH